MGLPAIGYARTSTEEQDISVDKQERMIRDYCEDEGIGLSSVQKEQVSGRKQLFSMEITDGDHELRAVCTDRPKLRFILDHADEYSKVVVKSPDRLARKVHQVGMLETLLQQADCPVVYLESQGSWLAQKMDMVIAEYEVRENRRRTRQALQEKQEKGEWTGRPPTGLLVGDDGKLHPDDAFMLRQLKWAADRYEAGDYGYTRAARESSADISKSQVRSVVNRDYNGIRQYLCPKALSILGMLSGDGPMQCSRCHS